MKDAQAEIRLLEDLLTTQLDHVNDYENIIGNVQLALVIKKLSDKYKLNHSTDVDIYLKDNIQLVFGEDSEYADVIRQDGTVVKGVVVDIISVVRENGDLMFVGFHEGKQVEFHANIWMEV